MVNLLLQGSALSLSSEYLAILHSFLDFYGVAKYSNKYPAALIFFKLITLMLFLFKIVAMSMNTNCKYHNQIDKSMKQLNKC
jgi:hypothetical protein